MVSSSRAGYGQIMSSQPTLSGRAGRIQITTADGPMGAYLARPAHGSHGAVIVCHQLFGVTPDITDVADRLAGLGYLAIAPDFYHRSGPDIALEATPEGRTRGFELLGQLGRAQVRTDIEATLAWLDGQQHQTSRTALVGMSVGGHIAYYAATQFPLPLAVVLYPTFLTSTDLPLGSPQPTLDLTAEITGRVLLVVGDQDSIVTAEQRNAITTRLQADKVRHEVVTIPGAGHAFFNQFAPTYHAAATSKSWHHIEQALAAHLRLSPDSR